jgi:antagonist of KipI
MQLPPGGQPILMLTEHPVTGGYPRIAQLASVDLPRLAQLRPGGTLRFQWIEVEQARRARSIRDRELEQLIGTIRTRLEEGT